MDTRPHRGRRANPAPADWAAVQRHRARLPQDIGFEKFPSYDFGRGGRLEQIAQSVGLKSGPVRHTGPRLVLTTPYRYETTPTAKVDALWLTSVPLLSITQKMGCFSFSMPAGPMSGGGTCPLSLERVTAKLQRGRGQAEVRRQFRAAEAEQSGYICDGCYAGKGSYVTYPLQAMRSVIRKAWTQAALDASAPFDFFVMEMIKAISFTRAMPKSTQRTAKVNTNYFRVHDAGDVWSERYWQAWLRIAWHFTAPGRRVQFWMPTRQWAAPAWREIFRRSEIPPNMVVRPSALFFGATAPTVRELAAGSTASACPMGSLTADEQGKGVPFGPTAPLRTVAAADPDVVWDCPTFLADNPKRDANCISMKCRICWNKPDVAVSYHEH